jgi:adenine specific DNA methylase Mod
MKGKHVTIGEKNVHNELEKLLFHVRYDQKSTTKTGIKMFHAIQFYECVIKYMDEYDYTLKKILYVCVSVYCSKAGVHEPYRNPRAK